MSINSDKAGVSSVFCAFTAVSSIKAVIITNNFFISFLILMNSRNKRNFSINSAKLRKKYSIGVKKNIFSR